jgi:hypothetical protein
MPFGYCRVDHDAVRFRTWPFRERQYPLTDAELFYVTPENTQDRVEVTSRRRSFFGSVHGMAVMLRLGDGRSVRVSGVDWTEVDNVDQWVLGLNNRMAHFKGEL